MTNVAMLLDDLMSSIATALPEKVEATKQDKVIDLDSVDWYIASPALLKASIKKHLKGNEALVALEAKKAALKAEERAIYNTVARPALEKVLTDQPLQDFTSTYAGEVLTFAQAARRAQKYYTAGVANGKLEESARKALMASGYVEYSVGGEVRLLQAAQRKELDALENYFGLFKSVPTSSREAVALLQESLGGEKNLAI